MVGDVKRTFVLYLPSGHPDKALMPLVIALHGRLGTGKGMEHLTHLEKIAEREKFVLLYPDGIRKSWNDGRGTPAAEMGIDDVGFIRALIDSAIRHLPVDPHQVFVAGISNGGFMTMRLACELSDKIAAVAVIAATMDVATTQSCQPGQPVSVLLVHGVKDPLVPIEGGSVRGGAGGPILSHTEAIKWWVERDHCQPEPTETKQLPDSAGDGTSAKVISYGGGVSGSEVISYVIENGGHTWPGGWQYLPVWMVGKTSRNLDAGELTWDFFRRHAR